MAESEVAPDDVDSPSPIDAMDATPLRNLYELVRARETIEKHVAAAVGQARDMGIHWGYIAAVLDTTVDAARRTYDRPL